jgi:hypothetical protein
MCFWEGQNQDGSGLPLEGVNQMTEGEIKTCESILGIISRAQFSGVSAKEMLQYVRIMEAFGNMIDGYKNPKPPVVKDSPIKLVEE